MGFFGTFCAFVCSGEIFWGERGGAGEKRVCLVLVFGFWGIVVGIGIGIVKHHMTYFNTTHHRTNFAAHLAPCNSCKRRKVQTSISTLTSLGLQHWVYTGGVCSADART